MLVYWRRVVPIVLGAAILQNLVTEGLVRLAVIIPARQSGWTLDSSRWLAGLSEVLFTHPSLLKSVWWTVLTNHGIGMVLSLLAEALLWRRAASPTSCMTSGREVLRSLGAVIVQSLWGLPLIIGLLIPLILAHSAGWLDERRGLAMVALCAMGLLSLRVAIEAARCLAVNRLAPTWNIRTLPLAVVRVLKNWPWALLAWLCAITSPLLAAAIAGFGLHLVVDTRHAWVVYTLSLVAALLASLRKSAIARATLGPAVAD